MQWLLLTGGSIHILRSIDTSRRNSAHSGEVLDRSTAGPGGGSLLQQAQGKVRCFWKRLRTNQQLPLDSTQDHPVH